MMSSDANTPPMSPNPDRYSPKADRTALTLDLSDLPPLMTPAPPSNTLLLTNLQDLEIFTPTTLAHIRELIDKHTGNNVYTFSPIRSFRRIIITFYSIESSIAIRALLDGEFLFNSRIRIYFGEPTPIAPEDDKTRHLAAPKADKQFFISPPPSPPHGWESKEEDPPNKNVHAEDLALALERLNAHGSNSTHVPQAHAANGDCSMVGGRKRSGSTIVFDPQQSGNSPDLPAIAVEDTTDSPEAMTPPNGEVRNTRVAMPKTERPPTDMEF